MMYALDGMGNKTEWNGNKWNPLYDNSSNVTKKITNRKVTSYHFLDKMLTNKDFVSDY